MSSRSSRCRRNSASLLLRATEIFRPGNNGRFPSLLAPKYAATQAASRARRFYGKCSCSECRCRCAFETQPVKYLANPRTSGCTNARIITSRPRCTRVEFCSIRARTMYESATRKCRQHRYGTMQSPGEKFPGQTESVRANHSML